MSDPIDQPHPEIDLLDVLEQRCTLHVVLPSDPALAKVCLEGALHLAQRATLRAALRPTLDQMKFDLDAAQRGAFPPAKAD